MSANGDTAGVGLVKINKPSEDNLRDIHKGKTMKLIKDFRVKIISLNPKGHTSILSMKESVDIQRLNQRVNYCYFLGKH